MNTLISKFDPQYVLISKAEFATMLNVTPKHLDIIRGKDPKCPTGFAITGEGTAKQAKLSFILQECYDYVAYLTAKHKHRVQEAKETKNLS